MKYQNMYKKLAAVILSSAMIMGSLTGCGDAKVETQTAGNTSESVQKESVAATESVVEKKDPVELTYYGGIGTASSTLTNLGEMEIMQVADEKCNTKITFVHPAIGAEKETFNLKLSSREFEDIIEYSWGTYAGGAKQALEDGVIIDLAPYIDAGLAPNFKKILDENPAIRKQISTDEGEIYAFPPIGDPAVNVTGGLIIREDMLKAVGMDAPETIEEWEAVLTAFKEKLGVESPFTCVDGNLIGAAAWFAGAFGTYGGYHLEDGKVQYGYITDGFKAYTETMARWYQNGLIDPDAFGNNSKAVQSNILNDKSGATVGNIGNAIGTYTNNVKAQEGANPDFKLMAVQYPVLKEGDEPQFIKRSWDVREAGQAAISSSCKDVEAAVAYLDFWYSEEGNLLKNFGIEGLSYEMVNGEPVYTDLILKNPDGLSVTQTLGRYTRASQPTVGLIDVRYYEQYYQLEEQVEAMKLWNTYAANALDVLLPNVSLTAEEAEEVAALEGAFKTYVEEELTKFIMGTRDINEYDDFVKTVKSMGAERCIEIKQAAYERYLAK